MNKTTEALNLAEEALNAMLTHMGMDEDEWTKPTFNQAREALAAIRAALAGQEKQEPVYAFRRRGLDDFCTCTKERYEELVDKPNLFEVTTFYAASVSAEPCKECGAKQAQIDRLMLEYCPDEMTHEQMQEWEKNIKPFVEPENQEPVAWLNPHNQAVIDVRKKKQIGEGKGYPNFSIPLYAAPVSAEAIRAEELEAIYEEFYTSIMADLEHGIKSSNERAADKFKKEYPHIYGFWFWMNTRMSEYEGDSE